MAHSSIFLSLSSPCSPVVHPFSCLTFSTRFHRATRRVVTSSESRLVQLVVDNVSLELVGQTTTPTPASAEEEIRATGAEATPKSGEGKLSPSGIDPERKYLLNEVRTSALAEATRHFRNHIARLHAPVSLAALADSLALALWLLPPQVSAAVGSGEVLSVMGPSGAGKTTLLNLLTGEAVMGGVGVGNATAEDVTGKVTLNGSPLTPKVYRDQCAYVAQNDGGLFTFLSCRDHLRFAVTLFRGKCSAMEVHELTDALLGATGLASCENVRAGDVEWPGLSGGQRRRLSLAVALAKDPAVLIADEPTSGLDAAASSAIMRLLEEIASAARVAVVCTIHQPGTSVFANMDKLLLLSKGCTAYYGPASELMGYFASLGKPVPPGASVADHALDLVNADFTSEASVDAIIQAWRQQPNKPKQGMLAEPMPLPEPLQRAAWPRQAYTLLLKFGQLSLKDNGFLWTRLIFVVCLSLVYGLVYIDARHRDQVRRASRLSLSPPSLSAATSRALCVLSRAHTIKPMGCSLFSLCFLSGGCDLHIQRMLPAVLQHHVGHAAHHDLSPCAIATDQQRDEDRHVLRLCLLAGESSLADCAGSRRPF